jgi:hypothetical protein
MTSQEFTVRKRICTAADGYQFITSGFPNRSRGGRTFESVDGGIVVFLRDAYTFMYSSHEIFHAVNQILHRAGVHLDEDGEPWAYTIGLVTDWYIKWICKERKLLMFVPVDMVKPEYLEQINYKEE